VSLIPKKTFYLQFCMGTSEGHQKSIFNTPKLKKKNQDTYGIYPTKLASSTQKHKKVIKTLNQPKIFEEKEPKIRLGATRRNLQAQPKILKKSSKHQIYQSERKFCQKKHMFRTLKV
jgi:hypothetical protein